MAKIKCYFCNKKVKLHEQIICKCNYIFCPLHRLCHQHNCSVGINNKIIIKDKNPKIKNKKLEDI